MNKVNNKSYIGYCIDFKERKTRHFLCAKKGIVTRFYNAIRKYGEENFEWIILFDNLENIEECKKIEKLMIVLFDTYNNGYNSTLGGDGGFTGHNSGEFKKGQQSRNKGKKMSEEQRQKLSNAHKGIKLSKSHAESISKANKGRIVTKETREKIRKSLIGKKRTPEATKRIREATRKANNKPIRQFNIDKIAIMNYSSLTEASEITGISRSNISMSARIGRKSVGNFLWEYIKQ